MKLFQIRLSAFFGTPKPTVIQVQNPVRNLPVDTVDILLSIKPDATVKDYAALVNSSPCVIATAYNNQTTTP